MDIFMIGFIIGSIAGVGIFAIIILLLMMLKAIKIELNKEWWNS